MLSLLDRLESSYLNMGVVITYSFGRRVWRCNLQYFLKTTKRKAELIYYWSITSYNFFLETESKLQILSDFNTYQLQSIK